MLITDRLLSPVLCDTIRPLQCFSSIEAVSCIASIETRVNSCIFWNFTQGTWKASGVTMWEPSEFHFCFLKNCFYKFIPRFNVENKLLWERVFCFEKLMERCLWAIEISTKTCCGRSFSSAASKTYTQCDSIKSFTFGLKTIVGASFGEAFRVVHTSIQNTDEKRSQFHFKCKL